MSDIYSCSCDEVTIWLGAGTAESDMAMERMKEQPPFPRIIIELLHDLTITKDLEAIEHPLYTLTISLVEYWQRSWIIQETILDSSPTIRYGPKETSLHRLSSFVDPSYQIKPSHLFLHRALESIAGPIDPLYRLHHQTR
jgi:hypothetical protein